MNTTLLRIENLKKYFPIKVGLFGRIAGYVKAVDCVSLNIDSGEVVSLVGESGSGKTTIAKCILLLEKPTDGRILYKDEDIIFFRGGKLREYRRSVQAIFQNPFLSLDPRMSVFEIISEPVKNNLKPSKKELHEYMLKLLEMVGLDESLLEKYPHELSGGQAQRVAIARAISLKPKLLILDEPTSALDVSIQAQILNLLVDLKNELGLSYLLITHDLSIVRYIGDRIIVMYLGRVMEAGLSEEIFNEPLHPYTQALFSSIPDPYYRESRRISLRGEPPSPINPPPGCRFHTRCPHAMEICERKEPPEYETSKSHKVYCWLYLEK